MISYAPANALRMAAILFLPFPATGELPNSVQLIPRAVVYSVMHLALSA